MIATTPLFEEGMISNALNTAKRFVFGKRPKPEGSTHERYSAAARKVTSGEEGGVGGALRKVMGRNKAIAAYGDL